MSLREIDEVIGASTGNKVVYASNHGEIWQAYLKHDKTNNGYYVCQYIPKGTYFSELTDEMIAKIEWKMKKGHASHSATSLLWSFSKKL